MILNSDIERLFRSHKKLWAELKKRCMGIEEDDTQDAYLVLCQSREALRDKQKIEGYFLAVARNKYRERIRSTKKTSELSDCAVPDRDYPDQDAIRRAVEELEPLLRQVVENFLKGLSIEQTACILGIPVGTVKSRMYRARAALKIKLAPLYKLGVL